MRDGCQTCDGSSPSIQTSPCVSTSFESGSLSRFDSVRRRQMVRLRKRSDWFLSPALDDGASASLVQDSESRSVCKTHLVDRPSIAESAADLPICSVPLLCINDLDVADAETSSLHAAVEGYGFAAENSTAVFPADSSLSSTTSAAANCQQNVSPPLESSPASTKHLLQSDTHYFLVDRLYGGNPVGKKAENGDAC